MMLTPRRWPRCPCGLTSITPEGSIPLCWEHDQHRWHEWRRRQADAGLCPWLVRGVGVPCELPILHDGACALLPEAVAS